MCWLLSPMIEPMDHCERKHRWRHLTSIRWNIELGEQSWHGKRWSSSVRNEQLLCQLKLLLGFLFLGSNTEGQMTKKSEIKGSSALSIFCCLESIPDPSNYKIMVPETCWCVRKSTTWGMLNDAHVKQWVKISHWNNQIIANSGLQITQEMPRNATM